MAGSFHCECDALEQELQGIPVELEIKEWLSEWWRPLCRGGCLAPIVLVENRVISHGSVLNPERGRCSRSLGRGTAEDR